jgi:hypothetical protein
MTRPLITDALGMPMNGAPQSTPQDSIKRLVEWLQQPLGPGDHIRIKSDVQTLLALFQQAQQQLANQGQQMFFGCYLNMVSVVAADELRRIHNEEWSEDRPLDKQRIMDTAKELAVAALAKLGVTIT